MRLRCASFDANLQWVYVAYIALHGSWWVQCGGGLVSQSVGGGVLTELAVLVIDWPCYRLPFYCAPFG